MSVQLRDLLTQRQDECRANIAENNALIEHYRTELLRLERENVQYETIIGEHDGLLAIIQDDPIAEPAHAPTRQVRRQGERKDKRASQTPGTIIALTEPDA